LSAYESGLCVWNDATEAFERRSVVWAKTDATPNPPPMPMGHAIQWTAPDNSDWVLFGDPLPKLRCPARFEAWMDPRSWEVLKPQEALVEAGTNQLVKPHSGSISWNSFRQRWVTVFMQWFGKPSAFGEVWYAESTSPLGPWGAAVKVLTHENYTFYNPRLRPDLSSNDSPLLFFEGTYTAEFADHAMPTPRYNYNQILYSLDLRDSRLSGTSQNRTQE
jgi:hypothetical protein